MELGNRKDYCSVCLDMRLICQEPAELQRFWSVQPSARKGNKKLLCERKRQPAPGRRINSKIMCLQELLHLEATPTVGFFLFPDLARLQGHPCHPTGRAQLGSPASQLRADPTTLSPASGLGRRSVQTPRKGHELVPQPPCHLDGPLKSEAQKASLSYQERGEKSSVAN